MVRDFDLIRAHADRVLVGLSITGTLDKAGIIGAIEPQASPLAERLDAIKEARRQGLRVYGMFCPLLPGIADAPEQIDCLIRFAADCGAEEVFVEPANARGTRTATDAGGVGCPRSSVMKQRPWDRSGECTVVTLHRPAHPERTAKRPRALRHRPSSCPALPIPAPPGRCRTDPAR